MDQPQVMVGNFPAGLRAEELAAYLQRELGIVDRCKVKRINTNTPPHAFVQFVSSAVAAEACCQAAQGGLKLNDSKLRIVASNGGAGLLPWTGDIFGLRGVRLQLGTLTSPQDLLVSWGIPEHECSIQIDRRLRKMSLFFQHAKTISENVNTSVTCDFKLELSLKDVRSVKEVQRQRGRVPELMVLLQLWTPPLISYRTADDDVYCATRAPLPDDDDPWIRTVDFTPNKSIGRCFTYVISVCPSESTSFRKMIEFLKVQGLCDQFPVRRLNFFLEQNLSIRRQDFFLVPQQKGIPFEIMFHLNALVHRGIINTSSLTEEFFGAIRSDCSVALYALRHMLTYRHAVFDGVSRLQQVMQWPYLCDKSKEDVLPTGRMLVHRMIVTPTRAICSLPQVEMSNRVIRHFQNLSDRFLRVSFADDDLKQMQSSALTVPIAAIVRELSTTYDNSRTELYWRVSLIVKKGFQLCGRHYSFLAFSSNQLRDASAWFFAGDKHVKADHIRQWMGEFPAKNVAKYAARMGQCFSSTFPTLKVPMERVMKLPDVVRNGHIFSDGCGRIAPEFALRVAESLKLVQAPSVYQIRYAGYKGVLATWPIQLPSGRQYDLGLRNSMNKFYSRHADLEVVGWTKFLPCYLNRQIICLLSTLQVDNAVFKSLQDAQVSRLEALIDDPVLAHEVLTTTCVGDLHFSAVTMLQGGFHPRKEPHLYSMLLSIRASQLEDLVSKARIYVPEGRWLMGCMDETGLLNYGQCFIKVSGPSGSDSLQGDGHNQGHRRGPLQVITGKVIMAKNPCLHPGDIRILEAVDVPILHSMVDCLVVPQNGERPHPNEASGSDLDGDVYFTCWDQNLIPPSGTSWQPMVYTAHEPKDLGRPAKIEDVMEFFVRAMVNDSLGVICNAHVVHADKSPQGALDEDCLHLAHLAATAVDFPKTGKAAIMPYHLRPKQYPDYMEKEAAVTYQSENIIGKLYRSVTKFVEEAKRQQDADHDAELDSIFDLDLQVPGYEQYLEDAWATKISYDRRLRGLMSYFNVKREADVITGRLSLQTRVSNRRQSDLNERMIHAYASLRKDFQSRFRNLDPDNKEMVDGTISELKDHTDFTAKASAWYHVTYHPDWKKKATGMVEDSDDTGGRPMLSFPWLAADVLARIKSLKMKDV